MHRSLVALVSALVLASCSDPDPGEACLVNDDCVATDRCVNGMCVPRDLRDGSTPNDAPLTDATMADAPGLDAEICGMPCDTGNPCALGAFDCATGTPICVGMGPAANTVVCRESLGGCDPAETCDGASTECPPDLRTAAGETCRDSTGECDVAEGCDGSSPACPFDAFQPAATECSVGYCDGAGTCAGCVTGAPCQPSDPCRTGTLNCTTRVPTCTVAGNAPDGTSCGPTATGLFGACDGFAGECGETGTQSRDVTYSECSAGSCVSVVRPEQRECARATEGLACASRRTDTCARCESESCVDFISCIPGTVCCGLTCRSDCPRE